MNKRQIRKKWIELKEREVRRVDPTLTKKGARVLARRLWSFRENTANVVKSSALLDRMRQNAPHIGREGFCGDTIYVKVPGPR